MSSGGGEWNACDYRSSTNRSKCWELALDHYFKETSAQKMTSPNSRPRKQAHLYSIDLSSVVEPEPELQGAETFGWSRSRSRNVEVSAPAPSSGSGSA